MAPPSASLSMSQLAAAVRCPGAMTTVGDSGGSILSTSNPIPIPRGPAGGHFPSQSNKARGHTTNAAKCPPMVYVHHSPSPRRLRIQQRCNMGYVVNQNLGRLWQKDLHWGYAGQGMGKFSFLSKCKLFYFNCYYAFRWYNRSLCKFVHNGRSIKLTETKYKEMVWLHFILAGKCKTFVNSSLNGQTLLLAGCQLVT